MSLSTFLEVFPLITVRQSDTQLLYDSIPNWWERCKWSKLSTLQTFLSSCPRKALVIFIDRLALCRHWPPPNQNSPQNPSHTLCYVCILLAVRVNTIKTFASLLHSSAFLRLLGAGPSCFLWQSVCGHINLHGHHFSAPLCHRMSRRTAEPLTGKPIYAMQQI